ncbi:MAG: Endoglucanase precursor [Myxococcaceae bacterium]|nr:Endoglucanase precursor [Myxococcaceae bacterium]
MPWASFRCGVFVAITAVAACACGARARACGGPAEPAEASSAEPAIHLIGRFEPPVFDQRRPARFAWSGSSFAVRFTGPSLTMRLRAAPLETAAHETATPYSVRVDGRAPVVVDVSASRERYELATGLDPVQPHDVVVTREAEAHAGVHELLGVDLGPDGRFLPPRERKLRIEVIGDSITCGYGVLGADAHCGFTFATERASEAYAARLGNALDADVTTVCWSGRGVIRNYDGSTTGTMPELFERTLPEDPPVPWSFAAAPPPDAVVINLGTNDFLGGEGRPLDLAAFEDAYVRFARRVREVHPRAALFITTSPMLHAEPTPSGPGTVKELARTRLEHVVARRTAEGDRQIELVQLDDTSEHWGCDYHPDVAMNVAIAARLAPVLRARIAR